MSSESQLTGAIEVFYSYSHKDERLRAQLETHLAILKREGIMTGWHDRKIMAGQEWDGKIDEHLRSAEIILLLVSADFLASDYCYEVEVKLAMERHDAGKACVIPIIVRPCDWQRAPFGKVQALPKDAKPITLWGNRDEAFLDIARGIRKVVEEIGSPTRTGGSALTKSVQVEVTSTPLLNIPRPPIIGFVARRDEQGCDIVERLKEALRDNQFVTLSGPGGVGKTTLAAEAARVLEDDFGGRIVWSSAVVRADFTLSNLLDDIATQLGHEELRTLAPDAKAMQVHALVAGSPALIVLDNYETISGEAKINIAEWLTQAQCSALLTSRHSVSATRNIVIAAMSREEAQEFLERLVGQTQDTQIYSNKIRARIYETAEANPYIMQWVVGQIDAAQEPDTVLEELQHGEGDAAERVFERSFNLELLGEDGRAALLALSLFSPSASRAALAEVAGFGQDSKRLNEAVKNLRALWLIKGIADNSRFIIEGLTRSLAHAHLLRDAHADEFRHQFVTHFLNYAVDHAQQTPEDFEALEAERDNVLGAMDMAFEMANWLSVMSIANVLAIPYEGMLYVRGYWDEAISKSEQAVGAAQKAENEWNIAHFAASVAGVRMERGQYVEAEQTYQKALAVFRKLKSKENIAACLHQLGRMAQAQGELTQAQRLYDESLEIKKRLGDQSGIAITLHQLGNIAYDQGELTEARRLYDESLEISKSLGDQSVIAISLHSTANLLRYQGELTKARQLFEESLAITEKLGDKGNLALIFYNLGLLEEEEGNKTEAKRLWREALSMFEQLGSPYAEKVRQELERLEAAES